MIYSCSRLIFLAWLCLLFAFQTIAQEKTSKHLFPIVQNEKWGYMDKTGKFVWKPT